MSTESTGSSTGRRLASGSLERRKPLRRGRPLRARKKLRTYSDRRASEREERALVAGEALVRDRRTCQAAAKVPDVDCWGPLDPHEIIPRSAWAAGYLVLDNVIMVCRGHHRWIDRHPDAAHAVGLHGYSWERPDR